VGANQHTGEGRRKRLTVRYKEDEIARLEAAAKARRVSVVAFVRAASLAATLAVGCVDAGRFPQLAAEDRELFHRCWSSMERPMCGEISSGMYGDACVRDAEKKYADRPGGKRGKWLVAHGCPKDMVAAAQEDNDEEESR